MEFLAPPLSLDVLSNILSFVPSPTDLLSISLANHTFYTLVAPELAYRFVRSHLLNDAFWAHLVAEPALALRVRAVEVFHVGLHGDIVLNRRERLPDTVPRVIGNGRTEDVERSKELLIAALHVLVNLEEFTWNHWVHTESLGRTVYAEDVWLALRSRTQLQKLRVFDSGCFESLLPGFRGVYESQMFTIENLTHIEFKIHYVPNDIDSGDEDVDDGVDGFLLPGRVDISPLRDFLLCCPNLDHLALTINDRDFYHNHNGNPFTDLTPLFVSARFQWPHLSTLRLVDVLVHGNIMTQFLVTHPRLRSLSALLPFSKSGLPKLPFTLQHPPLRGFLPILEEVNLPPELLRTILPTLENPESVRVLRTIEPYDWDAVEVEQSDDNEEPENIPIPYDIQGRAIGSGEAKVKVNMDLLAGLRVIKAQNVRTLIQLGKLVDVTPNLEVIRLTGQVLDMEIDASNINLLHLNLIPYLSRWPRLVSLTGIPLLGNGPHPEQVARTLAAACPALREVAWGNGRVAILSRDENGGMLPWKEEWVREEDGNGDEDEGKNDRL